MHSLLLPLEESLAAAVDLLNLGVEGLGLRRSGIGRERSLLIGGGGSGIGTRLGRRGCIGGRGLALGLLLLFLQVVAIVGGEALIAATAAAAQDLPQQQRRQGRRRHAERNGLRAR